MAIRKSKSARRRELIRRIDWPRRAWLRWLARREVYYSLMFIVLFTCFGSLLVLSGRNRLAYREGQPVTKPIFSRIEFEAVDQEETQIKRQEEREKEPAVYKANTAYFANVREQLTGLILLAANERIQTPDDIPVEQRKLFPLNEAGLKELRKFVTEESKPSPAWSEYVEALIADLSGIVILTSAEFQQEWYERNAFDIWIQTPTLGEQKRRKSDILELADDPARFERRLRPIAERFGPALQATIIKMMKPLEQPTYSFDEVESERRREIAAEQMPDVKKIYRPNDALVKPAMDKAYKFAPLDIKLINQERDAYRQQLGHGPRTLAVAGNIGLVLILGVCMWIYFAEYYPRVVRNAMRGLAIIGLLLGCHGLALALTGLFGPESIYAAAVMPTLVAAIVLAIAYDQRFALALGSIHTLLITFGLNLSFEFTLTLLLGVATAVGQLNDVRKRSKLVMTGLCTGLAMATGVVLIGSLVRPWQIPNQTMYLLVDTLIVLATGFVAGLLVHGILPAVERVFKVTTSMTLKELNDASLPLLHRLAERAPGTYQHSLRIADLGEAAAASIGANSLLCRVGSMYHDIGKSNKPDYFVENQGGGPNKHNKLSPAMSLLIIVGHVKDGIEMAKEYHLPPVIRHMIDSHHGTTLVEYFYHAAKKQQKLDTEDTAPPSEFEFRYPGPKPQTKEAAIVMLCDGIEGAARTLTEPMPARLEHMVHQLASKRLMDGQFDECNLTFSELHKIEKSITKTLCAIYHGRIVYPGDEHPESDRSPQMDMDEQMPVPAAMSS